MDKVVKNGGECCRQISIPSNSSGPPKKCVTHKAFTKNALVKNAIVKGMDLQECATTVERNGQIGEHWA
ncbi:MAG: hypothetical protein IJ905_10210 [Fibrobacter sp.]|nr:hypothetical protein [Fibrobacter sp.]